MRARAARTHSDTQGVDRPSEFTRVLTDRPPCVVSTDIRSAYRTTHYSTGTKQASRPAMPLARLMSEQPTSADDRTWNTSDIDTASPTNNHPTATLQGFTHIGRASHPLLQPRETPTFGQSRTATTSHKNAFSSCKDVPDDTLDVPNPPAVPAVDGASRRLQADFDSLPPDSRRLQADFDSLLQDSRRLQAEFDSIPPADRSLQADFDSSLHRNRSLQTNFDRPPTDAHSATTLSRSSNTACLLDNDDAMPDETVAMTPLTPNPIPRSLDATFKGDDHAGADTATQPTTSNSKRQLTSPFKSSSQTVATTPPSPVCKACPKIYIMRLPTKRVRPRPHTSSTRLRVSSR